MHCALCIVNCALQKHPVLQHSLAVRGQHTFRVELDATHVEGLVLQGHNLSFVTLSDDFKAVGEVLLRHYPRMVATDGEILGHTRE